MNKYLAIIDPYMKSPELGCLERLTKISKLPCRYYQPTKFPLDRLEQDQNDAYIILGSACYDFDKEPWQKELSNIILKKLKLNIPVLGICYGHQLIAHAFGSEIEYYDSHHNTLTGRRGITLKKDFLGFKKDENFSLVVNHKQIISKLAPVLESVAFGSHPSVDHDFIKHLDLPFIGSQAHVESVNDIGPGEKFILHFLKHYKLIEAIPT